MTTRPPATKHRGNPDYLDRARAAGMRNAALRNAGDPAKLGKAVRIVRAGIDLGLVDLGDLTEEDDDDAA